MLSYINTKNKKVVVVMDFSNESPDKVFGFLMLSLVAFSFISALILTHISLISRADKNKIRKIRYYVTEACEVDDREYREIMKDMVGSCLRKSKITNGDTLKIKKFRDSYFRGRCASSVDFER